MIVLILVTMSALQLSSYGEMILGPHSGVDVLFENNIDDGKQTNSKSSEMWRASFSFMATDCYRSLIEGGETWINADLVAVVEAEGSTPTHL